MKKAPGEILATLLLTKSGGPEKRVRRLKEDEFTALPA